MASITDWLIMHAKHAPYLCFIGTLLAGLNLPISIDILMILSAFLAATTIPEKAIHLYVAILIGSYLSAMLSYWFGRILGLRLLKVKFFSKLLNPTKLNKIRTFYEKYGLWTLIVGRFIPCGVRNGIFMSTGMSKLSFSKFIARDALACFLWASACFYSFYTIGQNYQLLLQYLKTFNLLIISALSVTGIAIFWYKRKKKKAQALAKSDVESASTLEEENEGS